MLKAMKEAVLFPLQEAVLTSLQAMGDPQFIEAKLCGGTALSRCWLGHRLSFDLDFFLPEGFRAGDLAIAMSKAGIVYETRDIVDDLKKANQLHGYVLHEGQRLKVSFIEDAYFNVFPPVRKAFGALTVRTEEVPGLYHRKLRTVCGSGMQGDSFEGGRQTARDLFDLHVLSVVFQPIRDFMASLPYALPSEAFDNGLANMPWFDLMDELQEITCAPNWNQAKDVAYLQNSLFAQIGAVELCDRMLDEATQEPDPTPFKSAERRARPIR